MSQTITRQRSFTSSDTSLKYSPRINTEDKKKITLLENVHGVLYINKTSKLSAKWCIIHLLMAVLFYLEIFEISMSFFLGWTHDLFNYIDFALFIIFVWNLLTNLYRYCLPTFIQKRQTLSDKQKKLLGISTENEKFFKASSNTASGSQTSTKKPQTPPSYPMKRSPSRSTPNSVTGYSISPNTPSHYSPFQQFSPSRSQRYSPQRMSTPSLNQTWHTTSWENQSGQYSPYGEVSGMSNQGSSSLTNTPSPSVFLNRSRGQSPSVRGSQTSPGRGTSSEDLISDYDSLDKLIKKEEENDLRNRRSYQDSPQSSSFWSFGRSAFDYIPALGTYQLATKSRTPNQKDDDNIVESPFKQDEIWRGIGLKRNDIDVWTENIRKWIAETVLEPLVKEIEDVNEQLTKLGNSELHIGTVSHSSLQTLASTKSQQLPSLNVLLPYLNLTSNQEYLVYRLKDLAKGGCLRLYRWADGGSYKGKAWTNDLPTDAQIICHLFCTYMDTHLPSNPRYNDGKSFTGLHFMKTPEKPENKKSAFCIFQSRPQKPHFKVLVEDRTLEIPRGRNNLFHAVVVFLYYVKKNNYGMLERVNLGMSGINILWVIEKK